MDFTTTEAADDLGGLARTITESVCTPEHQRELDGLDQRFDRDLWGKLIEADILSTAAPESLGGGGFGVLEQAAVLVALGRQLAAVPYLESVVLGAGALAKFGSEALQQEWATPGDQRARRSSPSRSTARWARARCRRPPDGDGFKLTGSRTQVGYGPVADAFLVPAETDSGTKVFLVAEGRRRGDGDALWTPPGTAASGIWSCMVSRPRGSSAATGDAVSPGSPPTARSAAARISSACSSGRWSSRRSMPANASSSTGPSAASRPSRRDWPTATSTSRACG